MNGRVNGSGSPPPCLLTQTFQTRRSPQQTGGLRGRGEGPNAGWRVASGSRGQRPGVWVARPPASCLPRTQSCSGTRGGPCSSHLSRVLPGSWTSPGPSAVEQPPGLLCLGRGAGRVQAGCHPPAPQTQVASPRPRQASVAGGKEGGAAPAWGAGARLLLPTRGTSRPSPHAWRGAG